ncbi:hypothetical protein PRNP1_014528 [Phytophthora ramorum]
MGSARRLLLVAVLALAIAADTRTSAKLSTLTLSPDAGSLITTRDDSTGTSTTASTDTSKGVIGSAASDTNKVTKSPATETPATEAPVTPAPPSSDSGTTSTSGSGEQETTESPSSASATVSPGSESDRSSPESQSETSANSSSTSKSSTANVDTLNDSNGTISAGNGTTSMGTILPVVFGALACVGAIVMAVTYKKKRDANYADEDNRLSSDCEYASGADFTPDNRALSPVQEDTPPVAVRVPVLSTHSSTDLSASAAIADFTGTNSSVSSSSPFGSAHCKVRISSPVQNGHSSSETNMEFQDTAPRHNRGSNVVLTIEELRTDSSHTGPQVQM